MWSLPMMHWTSPYRDPQARLPPRTWDPIVQGHPQPWYHLNMGPHCAGTLCPPWYWHLVANIRDLFKLVHLSTLQLVLISGGYWSTFYWPVGGARPTGMIQYTNSLDITLLRRITFCENGFPRRFFSKRSGSIFQDTDATIGGQI